MQCAMDLVFNYQDSGKNSISVTTRSHPDNESFMKDMESLFGNVLKVYNDLLLINQEEEMQGFQTSTLDTNNEQTSSLKGISSFDLQKWYKVTELQKLPRSQLITLASTSHLYSPITWLLPSFYIQQQLTKIANDIYKDDQILLDEGYHLEHCRSMTYGELMDACRIRGLPYDIYVTIEEMRLHLTAYLYMMEKIQNKIHDEPSSSELTSRLYLFILYFPPALYSCQNKNMV